MTLAVVQSRGCLGLEAPLVHIEVHLTKGLPRFQLVGMPETAVKESKERVRSALMHAGFIFPSQRLTVNLAPADLPKEGGRFDLAIALGILCASGQLAQALLEGYEFFGELALTSLLRSVPRCLNGVIEAHRCGHQVIVPSGCLQPISLGLEVSVYEADDLVGVCAHLLGTQRLPHWQASASSPWPGGSSASPPTDLGHVRGQYVAKRALEIAATGGHHMLMIGPPGVGKSMLASSLPGILPPISEEAMLQVLVLHDLNRSSEYRGVSGLFRAPHHSCSQAALIGGGSPPMPGDISYAHYGVLFLDELPHFAPSVLNALREPLEQGTIHLSRAKYQAVYPADFQLIAAMNPCPCGYFGCQNFSCRCTYEQVQRYQARLSGPLLDRIDLHIVLEALSPDTLLTDGPNSAESSASVRARILKAREIQQGRSTVLNRSLSNADLEHATWLASEAKQCAVQAVKQLKLSYRAYFRLLRVARTVADLASAETVHKAHIQETLQYRQMLIKSGHDQGASSL